MVVENGVVRRAAGQSRRGQAKALRTLSQTSTL